MRGFPSIHLGSLWMHAQTKKSILFLLWGVVAIQVRQRRYCLGELLPIHLEHTSSPNEVGTLSFHLENLVIVSLTFLELAYSKSSNRDFRELITQAVGIQKRTM